MPIQFNPLPSQAELRELLEYFPETGSVIWRPRPDTCRVNRHFNALFAGREAGASNKGGPKQIRIEGVNYLLHRVLWRWMTDGPEPGEINHRNENETDNRWFNMRASTHLDLARNRKPNRSSRTGVKGVSLRHGRFYVSLKRDGRQVHAGVYDTLEAASAAAEGGRLVMDHLAG